MVTLTKLHARCLDDGSLGFEVVQSRQAPFLGPLALGHPINPKRVPEILLGVLTGPNPVVCAASCRQAKKVDSVSERPHPLVTDPSIRIPSSGRMKLQMAQTSLQMDSARHLV